MNPLDIKIVAAGEEVRIVAELAQSIWSSHYAHILEAEQISYMIEKYQSPEIIKEQINSGGYVYYLAYWDGKPAGYCGVVANASERSVFLSKIYVGEGFRRRGIARSFIKRFIFDNEKDGINHIWLRVNKRNAGSIEAYKKLGFEISQSVVQEIGSSFVMDDYKMVLKLQE
ncbi:MAG: GNAT family N-acetyltransferase [Clostridiales bacterium]|jgi:GNAT superfamily N-acetyltransferase|nr:GNAT family N-acetyltransferase [Clostridiales bacterium]